MVIVVNRFSFLSLCFYVFNLWVVVVSDYYVYYFESMCKRKIFCLILFGFWMLFSLVYMIGIGFVIGVMYYIVWVEVNVIFVGVLIVVGFELLKGFGLFCFVIVVLGIIVNSIFGCYLVVLGFQVLGRYFKVVLRWVWICMVVVLQIVLVLVGREYLFVLFQNFFVLMGYWVEFMILIFVLEYVLFRRIRGFDWVRWEDKSYLLVGWVVLVVFLLGWVGVVLGMYQIWYIGLLVVLVGVSVGGCDVGVWVGCGFVLVSFFLLRWLELRIIGR